MRALLLLLSTILLISCTTGQKTGTAKRYELKGEVVSLDAATQAATIKHEKIGDWMDAMTMEFPVKPKGDFDKLRPGMRVTGTVVVNGMDYYLTGIEVQR